MRKFQYSRIIRVACVIAVFLLSCDRSGTVDNSVQPVGDEEYPYGQIHNEILTAYSQQRMLFIDDTSPEEAINIFVRATNEVLSRRDICERIGYHDVEKELERLWAIGRESGFDFFHPGGDPRNVIYYLEDNGTLTEERANRLAIYWKNVATGETPREYLIPSEPIPLDPALNIAEYSAEWWRDYYVFMDAYVAEHPELQGWWDEWKKTIREISFIACDFLGGIIALPGGGSYALVGAALASIAFTFAWRPY